MSQNNVENSGNGAGVSDQILSNLSKAGVSNPSSAESELLSALSSGTHVQFHAEHNETKVALYGAWLAASGKSALVITSSEENVAKTAKTLSQVGCEVVSAETEGAFETAVKSSGNATVVTTAKIAGIVLKRGGSAPFVQCVVDSVDLIAANNGPSDIEVALLALRESQPEAQIVLIAVEPSLHLSALSRRFLNNPKSFSTRTDSNSEVEHWYYEIGNALLAKPQALCDLIEADATGSLLVFCNSPSDADFADVILKKRGISSVKLIGYVPQLKLSKALQGIQKGDTRVLVLTDVAARGVPLEFFGSVVNYSIPSDPEVYFHRYSAGSNSATKKVISLVSPLDIANFHYLKKLGKLEFKQAELPSPEQLFASKFEGLKKQAIESGTLQDPTISSLVDTVLGDKNSKEIVGLLLQNTLVVLPALKNASSSAEERPEMDDDSDDFQDDDRRGGGYQDRRGGGRGGRNQDRGDRNDRADRGGDRGPRRGRQGGDFDDDNGGDRGHQDDDRRDSRGGGRNNRRHRDDDREDSRPPREPRKQMPVDRDARLYVGQGKKHGLTAERLVSDIASSCSLTNEQIKRAFIREAYSFVDVPEEVGDEVVNQLSEAEFGKGEKYFVRRAVTISIPRPGAPESEDNSSSDDVSASDSDQDHSSMDEGDDDSSPTMLSVDEVN